MRRRFTPNAPREEVVNEEGRVCISILVFVGIIVLLVLFNIKVRVI
jgi:hypothetical protein